MGRITNRHYNQNKAQLLEVIRVSYEQNKARVLEKIRNGGISGLELMASRAECFMCKGSMEGKVLFVIDSEPEKESLSRYPIHKECYDKAKMFVYFNVCD